MNAQLSINDAPAAITPEGRFFRVSVIRKGRVESYLCETEAEARRFADLLSQPPLEVKPKQHRPAPAPKPPTTDGSNVLRFVRVDAPNWKAK